MIDSGVRESASVPGGTNIEFQPLIVRQSLIDRNCSVFTPQGQYLLPQRQLRFGRSIISIDYHNVLDKHPISNKRILYPVDGDHQIRQENRLAIQRLKDLGLAVIVISFVHTDWRKRSVVASCTTLPMDKIVITQTGDGTGWGGKLDGLNILCSPSEETSLIHIDDKASICSEFRQARGRHFGTCHIKYPGKLAVIEQDSKFQTAKFSQG